MTKDRVSENVKHIVSVVRKGEGMNDSVEFDDEQGRGESDADVDGNEKVLPDQPRKQGYS